MGPRDRLANNRVEANSGLGQAIGYFERHFAGLTMFCQVIDAHPSITIAMEQALKLILRGRKNSLFFKTPAGAAIADVITSVIATAYHAEINVFDYLIVLQRHADEVKRQPESWLPWNYQATLDAQQKAA